MPKMSQGMSGNISENMSESISDRMSRELSMPDRMLQYMPESFFRSDVKICVRGIAGLY